MSEQPQTAPQLCRKSARYCGGYRFSHDYCDALPKGHDGPCEDRPSAERLLAAWSALAVPVSPGRPEALAELAADSQDLGTYDSEEFLAQEALDRAEREKMQEQREWTRDEGPRCHHPMERYCTLCLPSLPVVDSADKHGHGGLVEGCLICCPDSAEDEHNAFPREHDLDPPLRAPERNSTP